MSNIEKNYHNSQVQSQMAMGSEHYHNSEQMAKTQSQQSGQHNNSNG
jgi:hypothetical protein